MDQWQIKVSGWFAVAMAKLQQLVVGYATGPAYVPAGTAVDKPSTKEEEDMCGQQVVRSVGGTLSFSVFGVAIILIVGAILIFLGLVLDIVVGWTRERLRRGMYKAVQWGVDEKLQLQRMAFEEAGMGTWRGGDSAVPVAGRGDVFGLPAGWDFRHPRLGGRGDKGGRTDFSPALGSP